MNEVLVAALSALILGAIGTGVRFVNAYITAHFKPQQMGAVFDLARTAVNGAQQWGLDLTGPDKLDFAVNALVEGAKKLGLKLTVEEASSFIHAALREMKQVQAFQLQEAAAA
jgi:hypothetical protein